MYCSRLFVVGFQDYILLNLIFFVESLNYIISLPSFMFVTATVSEICEANQKEKEKKNSEIDYFKTFPEHKIYPFFNQRYLLSTCMHSIC